MNYRRLGRTGLKVAPLCLGTMQWGWSADESTAREIMDAYTEAGGNFIDTADIYSRWVDGNEGGVSEEIIGRWMQSRNNRDQIVLATKVRGPMGPGPNDKGLSRKHIIDGVNASLRRLQTDYIDLYQTHFYDDETPIDETVEALDRLVQDGKVRYVGCSNYTAWRLVEALWSADKQGKARYDSLQPHYNLVHRSEFEKELAQVCTQYGIGVIPYSPLAGGFLTGKYSREQAAESVRAESIDKRYNNDRSWSTLDAVRAVADETESTPVAVSLAWLLAQPAVTAPIIGANSIKQLQGSMGALELSLSDEQVQRLTDASAWED